ncbi:SDR family NAD(P)-dependent oxidoreductase [Actinacidiphila glaucinigra]|uniref:SDR family NAD(P)-dependent oxidoreductase n=1 Tax=Actinacidiphila glaucinigra TaxID=235986 RepID=UPI0033D5A596
MADIENAGGRAIALPPDVTKGSDLQTLFAQTVDRFGSVDILVNNAGVYEWPHRRSDRARLVLPARRQRPWSDPRDQGGQAVRPPGRQHHQHQHCNACGPTSLSTPRPRAPWRR